MSSIDFNQLYKWLKPQLRRICRRWPHYYEVLNKVKEVQYLPTKSGHGRIKRVFFKCAHCHGSFDRKHVNIDHISAIVDPALGNVKPDFNELITRMFCGPEGLQVLCTNCHSVKSKHEREQRKANRVPKEKKKRVRKKKASE